MIPGACTAVIPGFRLHLTSAPLPELHGLSVSIAANRHQLSLSAAPRTDLTLLLLWGFWVSPLPTDLSQPTMPSLAGFHGEVRLASWEMGTVVFFDAFAYHFLSRFFSGKR